MFKDYPLEKAASLARKIGYEGIEIRAVSHLPVATPITGVREIKKFTREEGLEVAGIYTATGRYSLLSESDCKKQLGYFKRYVEMGSELEVGFIKQSPGGPSPRKAKDEDFRKAATWMARAADYAQGFSLRVAMEVHHGGLTETADSALKLLSMIGGENVGVIYDPGNMFIAHTEYGKKAVEKLGRRIFHVHVKDESKVADMRDPSSFRYKDEIFCHKLLGEGDVDHLTVFKALKGIGYQRFLSCECHRKGEPFALAKHEFQKLRELLAQIRC